MTTDRAHRWYTLRCLRRRICRHCQHVDLRNPASQRITRQPCKAAPTRKARP